MHGGDFISYMCDGELHCRDASDESLYQCFQVSHVFSTMLIYLYIGIFGQVPLPVLSGIPRLSHIGFHSYFHCLTFTFNIILLQANLALYTIYLACLTFTLTFTFSLSLSTLSHCRQTSFCIRSTLPVSLSFLLSLSHFHF